MRDVLVVIDSKYDRREKWDLYETKMARFNGPAADEVRDLCTHLGTTGHLAFGARVRVRSFPGIGWPEAFTTDLDAIEPSAVSIYPPLAERGYR